MNATRNAIAAGLRRGAIEMRNSLQNPADLGYYVISNLVFVVIILFNRDINDDLGMAPARFFFPGTLAMITVFVAVYGLATVVAGEREDGTLLRSKSIPLGTTGYVVGQTTRTTLELAFSLTLVLGVGSALVPGLWENGAVAVLGLVGLLMLGLLASLPLGFVLGSIFKNPRSLGGWGFIVFGALIAISGVFAPIVALPPWVQVIGQIFPLYWLGLGMRSLLLPDTSVVLEIGESWRTLEMLGVLGLWAVIGLLLAPVLLRRMARRESGSDMEARRQRAMQRVG